MTFSEKEEILDSYSWIKIKKFSPDDFLTLEKKYEALEKHHKEETEFLIEKVRELAKKYGPQFDFDELDGKIDEILANTPPEELKSYGG